MGDWLDLSLSHTASHIAMIRSRLSRCMPLYPTGSSLSRFIPRASNNTNISATLFSSSAAHQDDGDELQSNIEPADKQIKTRRRSRRRTANNNANSNTTADIPSLADFIHRSKVFKQYRTFIRLAHYVDEKDTYSGAGGECRAALEEVRLSYKMGVKKGEFDALSKNMAYTEGERKLRELETMTGYSAHRKQSTTESAEADESYDDDSWINTKDEEDKRGRVGTQWPWEK